MMRKLAIYIFILYSFLNCGNDSTKDTLVSNGNILNGNSRDCKNIIVNESLYSAALVDDFKINKALIEDDFLKLDVQYGGGCGTTNFELLTTHLFLESDPVQLEVIVSFEDNDSCEALIQEQVCFDLSALAKIYKDSYQTNSGTIILRFGSKNSNLRYDF